MKGGVYLENELVELDQSTGFDPRQTHNQEMKARDVPMKRFISILTAAAVVFMLTLSAVAASGNWPPPSIGGEQAPWADIGLPGGPAPWVDPGGK